MSKKKLYITVSYANYIHGSNTRQDAFICAFMSCRTLEFNLQTAAIRLKHKL